MLSIVSINECMCVSRCVWQMECAFRSSFRRARSVPRHIYILQSTSLVTCNICVNFVCYCVAFSLLSWRTSSQRRRAWGAGQRRKEATSITIPHKSDTSETCRDSRGRDGRIERSSITKSDQEIWIFGCNNCNKWLIFLRLISIFRFIDFASKKCHYEVEENGFPSQTVEWIIWHRFDFVFVFVVGREVKLIVIHVRQIVILLDKQFINLNKMRREKSAIALVLTPPSRFDPNDSGMESEMSIRRRRKKNTSASFSLLI